MKKYRKWSFALLTVLLGIASSKTLAHDIAVANDDGVTIYYNRLNDKELEVSFQGSSYDSYDNEYVGNVVIPDSVTYNGTAYYVTSIGNNAFYNCHGLTSVTISHGVISIGQYAFYKCSGLTSVTINNDVTSIGDYAFASCSSLPSIIIPNSVTSIGNRAFSGCKSLTSLTIPNSVTSIEEYTFSGCSGLSSITIPNSVTTIGFGAFSHCTGLTNITIPNTVTIIDGYSFSECSSLTSITIPNSVNSIGSNAFYDCINLANINIPNSVTRIDIFAFWNTMWYNNQPDGLIYAGKVAYEYKGTMPANTNIELKEGTVSISPNAFSGCRGLTNIAIPNSVTNIGQFALSNTMWYNNQPDGLIYAGKVAYEYKGTMPANTIIEIKEGTVSISPYAFSGCRGLTNIAIPNSVASIGNGAFQNCSSLTAITIPNSVTSIEEYTFSGCTGLTNATISNGVINIGRSAFDGCSSLASITIPNTVTSIKDFVFKKCSSLTSIIIPNSVTTIGNFAFSGCSGLTSVAIPNGVKTIGDDAFESCSGLSSITLSNSVTTIGRSAFYRCSSLTSVTIPNSVANIDDNAFYGCPILERVYCYPEKTPYLGSYAFSSSPQIFVTKSALQSYKSSYSWRSYSISATEADAIEVGGLYYFLGVLSPFAVVTGKPNGTYDNHTIEIPETITEKGKVYHVECIGNHAFQNCSGMTSVTIPNSVTSIGDASFAGCSSLTSVTIPNSVTSIGNSSFSGCSSLTSVTIPNSVTSIDNFSFRGCSSLISVTLPNSLSSISYHLFDGCSGLISIIIPNSVSTIGSGAFYNCTSLISITIPNSVTSIGEAAFSSCRSLTSVTIPNSVTSIGNSSFFDCSSLSSVTIGNSVTTIGSSAFSHCSSLTSVTIPNSVTSIGSYAFSNCSGLTSISIGNSVTSIEYYAFAGCSGLTSIVIPEGITSIEKNTFSECSGLIAVILPNSLTTIEESAFDGCIKIQSINMPEGLILIKKRAFFKCSSLIDIIIPSSVEVVYQEAFSGCAGLAMINVKRPIPPFIYNDTFSDYSVPVRVPVDCVEKYKNHDVWKNFVSISDEQNYKLTYIVDGEEYKTYELQYGATIIPEVEPTKDGYTFSGWSEIPTTMPAHNVTIYGSFISIYQINGHEYVDLYLPSGNAWALTNLGSDNSYYWWYDNIDNVTQEWGSNWSTPTRADFQELFDYCTWTWETHGGYNGYRVTGQNGNSIFFPAFGYINNSNFDHYNQVQKKDTVLLYWTIDKLSPSISGCPYALYGDSSVYHVNNYYHYYRCSLRPVAKNTISRPFYTINYFVDGELYKSYQVQENAAITPEPAPTKEGYSFSGWIGLPTVMPAYDVTVTGTFSINSYKLTYIVDGQTYKTFDVEYGAIITPEDEPTKEGHTFSGWSDIPSTMPAHDVTVSGTFTINSYWLTYMVDNQVYRKLNVEYNTVITPIDPPSKEGHTFSGWSNVPTRMPAHDVTVSGTFTANKYLLMYIVDGQEYKSYEVEYGTAITPEPEPVREGYTFSGWIGLPDTMPARVVIVTGTFTQNKYMLTYLLNDKLYKLQELVFGETIIPEPPIEKEGHTFSGWSEIPATMPAHDVMVRGTLTVNKYILAYILDGREYKTLEVEYGTVLIPEPDPVKEGYSFSGWIGLPETMPARLVIVTGTFSINSYKLTYMIDNEVYKEVMYEYGATITPEPQPEGDYLTFEWVGVPETMPAHDVVVTAVYETGIIDILTLQGIKAIYTPNGKKLDKPQKGLNIVVMQDGTVKKVYIK